MSQSHDPSPFNPLPPVVWLLLAALVAPEVVFSLGEAGLAGGAAAVGWRLQGLNDYAFSGQAFDYMIEHGVLLPEHLHRLVTYPFVHGSFTSTVFACVILLAMGKMVGEVMGGWAVLLLFVLCGVFGALVFALLTDQAWLSGAYPSVYGLIGVFTFLYWQKLAATGGPQAQAFTLIGVLMGLQLLFGMFFQVGYSWVAELSGFCAGFALAAFVMPGGWARLVAALRRR
ncbi:MAG: rhomboid family intramembrane serine protease [Pseudomonadota bacterium]